MIMKFIINSNKMRNILKMKWKLKIMRDNIVDEYVKHTMTSRIMNFVQ